MKTKLISLTLLFSLFFSVASKADELEQMVKDLQLAIESVKQDLETQKRENEKLMQNISELNQKISNLSTNMPSVVQPDNTQVKDEYTSLSEIPVEALKNGEVSEDFFSNLASKELGQEIGKKSTGSADLDLDVPDSPALSILGISSEDAISPTTPRALASQLINGLDKNGNFQSGLAVDFAPFMIFKGNKVNILQYRDSPLLRFFSRMQLSYASVKGANDDDKSLRLASGVRFTLLDKGDPRRKGSYLDTCFENNMKAKVDILYKALRNPLLSTKKLEEQKAITTAENVLKEDVSECHKEARKKDWNNTSWVVGIAPTWISPTGETSDLGWNGYGVWTSFAYGFEGLEMFKDLRDNAQLILHARYRTDEETPMEGMEGEFLEQDSFLFAGRLQFGISEASGMPESMSSQNLRFQLEGSYTFADPSMGENDKSYQLSGGIDVRLRDNLWLELSVGGKSETANTGEKSFILSALKWGFQSADAKPAQK